MSEATMTAQNTPTYPTDSGRSSKMETRRYWVDSLIFLCGLTWLGAFATPHMPQLEAVDGPTIGAAITITIITAITIAVQVVQRSAARKHAREMHQLAAIRTEALAQHQEVTGLLKELIDSLGEDRAKIFQQLQAKVGKLCELVPGALNNARWEGRADALEEDLGGHVVTMHNRRT